MDSYCMQCYLKRNIDLVRPLGSEIQATAFAKELMKLFLAAPEEATAPSFGPQVAQLLHDMYGLAMAENIAHALGIEETRVNVKATTEERLGFTGSGEGMSCHAVCLLEERPQ